MRRFAPLAAILISFVLVGCESLATQSGGPPKASQTASIPVDAGLAGAMNPGHSSVPVVAGLIIAGIGYVLLQVFAGGDLTGSRNGAAGFFGHLFTGGSAILVRLFDNIVRFVAAQVTGTPRIPVSLVTGNPNPNAIYIPRAAEEAEAAATQAPVAGLGLSGSKSEMGLMQDLRGAGDLRAPALAEPVGSNGKS